MFNGYERVHPAEASVSQPDENLVLRNEFKTFIFMFMGLKMLYKAFTETNISHAFC